MKSPTITIFLLVRLEYSLSDIHGLPAGCRCNHFSVYAGINDESTDKTPQSVYRLLHPLNTRCIGETDMLLRPVGSKVFARSYCDTLCFQKFITEPETVIGQPGTVCIKIKRPIRRYRYLKTKLFQGRQQKISSLFKFITSLPENFIALWAESLKCCILCRG